MAHKNAPSQRNTTLGLERIVFFSDAVMAIAITLLALDIRVPDLPREVAAAQLPAALAALAPRFFSLFVSFMVIGIFWLSHHRYFEHIRRYDRRLILINLLFLLCVVCVPFVTNLLGSYAPLPIASVVYSLCVAAMGALMTVLWWYATVNHRLVDADLSPLLIREFTWRALLAPLTFLISIPFAFVDFYFAVLIWCLAPAATLLLAPLVSRRLGRHQPAHGRPR